MSVLCQESTASVSLAEVFHPWVRWEGSNSLAHKRANKSGSWAQIESVHIHIFPVMSKNNESGLSDGFAI